MERFASETGLLTEQVWDEPDRPEAHMFLGRPTTAAMPLMWAHGEYIKLLRSVRDGRAFDFIPEVAARYQDSARTSDLEIWKSNRQPRRVRPGTRLRIQAPASFILRWSTDDWNTAQDTDSSPTALGIAFADIAIPPAERGAVRFTFRWKADGAWEGRDFEVGIE
jgi:glucoamylase